MSNPFAAPNPPDDPDGRAAGPPPAPYSSPPSAPGYGNPYPSPEPPAYGTPAPPSAPNPYGAPAGYGAQGTFGSPPPGYDYGYQPVPSTNGKAIASLVLAILGLLCFAVLTAGPAIILGNSARREIRAGKGTGDGIALAGIVIGWIITGFTMLLLVAILALYIVAPEEFNTAP